MLEWSLVLKGTEASVLVSGQAGQSEGKLGRLGLPPRTLSCDWRAPTGLKKDLEAPRGFKILFRIGLPGAPHCVAQQTQNTIVFVFLTPLQKICEGSDLLVALWTDIFQKRRVRSRPGVFLVKVCYFCASARACSGHKLPP